MPCVAPLRWGGETDSGAGIACARQGVPPVYRNLPAAVAAAAGARNATKFFYTSESGSSPQFFVNMFCERIAAGTDSVVVVAGGEALVSSKKMGAMGKRMAKQDQAEVMAMFDQWRDPGPPGVGPPTFVGSAVAMRPDPLERAHGVAMPTAAYPLAEQALRHELGLSIDQHRQRLGELCAGMSAVAAAPENATHAWFPEPQSAASITTVDASANRMVGFPYTKRMNSMLFVDQAAGCLLMSAGKARALGIPESQFVYLHGCGDAAEPSSLLRRKQMQRSAAMQAAGQAAFAMVCGGTVPATGPPSPRTAPHSAHRAPTAGGNQAGGVGAHRPVHLLSDRGLRRRTRARLARECCAVPREGAWAHLCLEWAVHLAAAGAQAEWANDGGKLTLIGGLMYNGGPVRSHPRG